MASLNQRSFALSSFNGFNATYCKDYQQARRFADGCRQAGIACDVLHYGGSIVFRSYHPR